MKYGMNSDPAQGDFHGHQTQRRAAFRPRARRNISPAQCASIPCSEAPPIPRARPGAAVNFEPGTRTAWHTHPLGQTLIVTAGLRPDAARGRTGGGDPARRHRLVRAGQKALTRRGAKDPIDPYRRSQSAGRQAAVAELEPVSDEQYAAAQTQPERRLATAPARTPSATAGAGRISAASGPFGGLLRSRASCVSTPARSVAEDAANRTNGCRAFLRHASSRSRTYEHPRRRAGRGRSFATLTPAPRASNLHVAPQAAECSTTSSSDLRAPGAPALAEVLIERHLGAPRGARCAAGSRLSTAGAEVEPAQRLVRARGVRRTMIEMTREVDGKRAERQDHAARASVTLIRTDVP